MPRANIDQAWGGTRVPKANKYIQNPNTAPSGGGDGYWTAPDMSINSIGSQRFAQKNYSPQFLGGINQMYGAWGENLGMLPDTASEWRGARPQSLAELYQRELSGLGSTEREQYNQAQARLRGGYNQAQEGLMNSMGARRGGAGAGAMLSGLGNLSRAYMTGTQDIATGQAIQNIANRENRLKELMGYSQGDIANQQGWLAGLTGSMGTDWANRQAGLQGQTGWLSSMMPYEQFNITTPWQQAAQQAQARLAGQTAEERINAQRRAEAMNELGMLMGWQGQQAGQYGQGTQDWLNYQNMMGNYNLQGYNPSWLNWTNY